MCTELPRGDEELVGLAQERVRRLPRLVQAVIELARCASVVSHGTELRGDPLPGPGGVYTCPPPDIIAGLTPSAQTLRSKAVRNAISARMSAEVACTAANRTRTKAIELRAAARALRAERRADLRARVIRHTELADAGVFAWSSFDRHLGRQAALVGRDPVIEEAKTVLVERYRITRAQAFEILRVASMRSNRKLHDIARTLVDESR